MTKQLNIDMVVKLPLVVPSQKGALLNADNFTMLSELPMEIALEAVTTTSVNVHRVLSTSVRLQRVLNGVEIDMVPSAFKMAARMLERELFVRFSPIDFPDCFCGVPTPEHVFGTHLDEFAAICGGYDVIKPIRALSSPDVTDTEFLTVQQPEHFDFDKWWVRRQPYSVNEETSILEPSPAYRDASFSVVFPLLKGEKLWYEATLDLNTDILSLSYWLGDTVPKKGFLVKRPI